jgi:phage recombination protein Bet
MLETIRQTVCKGATEAQFRMFIEVCKATGLNPFLKEIYYAPQIGVMASRDGYLRKANDHPQFDGMETRVERNDQNVPIKATCSVWRKDRGHPVICEAYYSEYKKASQVWQQYPSAMIAKVAEVLALKRSFAINGVVTEEEIGEQGSKEAQQDYLRSKGIGIDAGVGAQPAERTKPAQGSLAAVAVKSPSNTPDVRSIRR